MWKSRSLIIVSNNPLVWDQFPECVREEGSVKTLLFNVQLRLAQGYSVLYSHPVAGNFRLLRNPFRSVILENLGISVREERTARDLKIVEELLLRLENEEMPNIREGDTADYRIIDLDLLLSVIPSE